MQRQMIVADDEDEIDRRFGVARVEQQVEDHPDFRVLWIPVGLDQQIGGIEGDEQAFAGLGLRTFRPISEYQLQALNAA